MKIRSRQLDKFVGVAGAGLVLAWGGTLDRRLWCMSREVNPYDQRHCGEYVFAAWHESIVAFALFGRPALYKTQVLISQHQDGEYITQIVQRLGARVVRGSTSRSGRAGLMEMARVGRRMHLAITPDGPRGPRRRLQPGAIFLASHTGLPIVPVGFGFSNAWRARSWDRFAVPLPFSLVACVAGHPITVPGTLSDSQLEDWRLRVERKMLDCTGLAERWAAGETPRMTRAA